MIIFISRNYLINFLINLLFKFIIGTITMGIITMKKKYYIETYGCEMNKSDSIDIALSFEKSGYVRAEKPEDADIAVLNTCAVRENAEDRIKGRIGFYKSLKNKNKNLVLVIAGCMAQEWGKKMLENYENVSVVVGTYHYLRIPELAEEHIVTGRRIVSADKKDYKFSPFRSERKEEFSAWVNIIKGCSNYCSYCIVPYLRGPEKSKPSNEIIREVSELAKSGVIEITLLGQNVNAYGKDSGDISFIELLERLNDIKGIKWIRYLTSHPKDFTVDMIRKIADLEKVCKHFHLPLQSGSDKILKLMNRRYTVSDYLRLVEAINKYIADFSITTDIIVGFPGESDDDFKKTLRVVEKVEFDDAFTYKYSTRPYTAASKMKDQVDSEVASGRLSELIELQRSITYKKNLEEIGREVEALVIRKSKKSGSEMLTKTEKAKMVVVETDAPVGSLIDIKINNISGNTLRGSQIFKYIPVNKT